MKILTAQQLRAADAYTVENEPIDSIDLMERASEGCVTWLKEKFPSTKQHFTVICGVGNNGGDGLAIARLLKAGGYLVEVVIVRFSENSSEDFQINDKRLIEAEISAVSVTELVEVPELTLNTIIIDAIFGTGLTRPASGMIKEVIQQINTSKATVVSIDIPSGLFCEDNTANDTEAVVKADFTLTFQSAKLSFLFPENAAYLGEWRVIPIGLNQAFIDEQDSLYEYVIEEDILPLLKNRTKFSHKGTFGHALLMAGSKGKVGAAVLASRACLRSGVGLLTTNVPACGVDVLQEVIPEAMCISDSEDDYLSELPDLSKYSAIGVGPGLGTEIQTQNVLKLLIQNTLTPLVIDADALNILSENKTWLAFTAGGTILTPHPGEFKRLVGEWSNDFDRLELQREFSKKNCCFVVLKGANTSITAPDGRVFFNSTGNPGMATAGSGDVLTGVITGLLAQGYGNFEAAIVGVYLHGLAGDIAAEKVGGQSMIASDIIENIGEAYKIITN